LLSIYIGFSGSLFGLPAGIYDSFHLYALIKVQDTFVILFLRFCASLCLTQLFQSY